MHSDSTPVARPSSRRILTSLAVAAAAAALAGCGATYRPVVASINPVGPAGQPTKYAVAISSASPTANGLVSLIDFSGDTILDTTLIGLNPYFFVLSNSSEGYTLNSDSTLTSFSISTSLIASQVLQSTLLPNSNPVSITPTSNLLYVAEGGRNAVAQLQGFPPAITQELPTGTGTIYTVGIAGAPRVFSLVRGATAASNGAAVTIDTTSATITTSLPVGINPTYGVMSSDTRRAFILNKGSNNITVINAQGNALDTFNTGSFTGTTTSGSPNITAVTSIAGLTPGQTVLGTGIPTGSTIVSATGTTVVLSAAATASATGVAVATISSTVPVGVAPVWADFAPTFNELLIANQGPAEFGITSYAITGNVITFQTSAQSLAAGQSLTLLNFPTSTFLNGQAVTVSGTGLSGTSFQVPFTHANATATEAGNGIGNGSVTIVSVPLCSQTTVTSNPNCDSANPIDAAGFGSVIATIPVGPSPVMIGVLQDGTQAFVANAGVLPTGTTPGIAGSVSAINLTSNTVIATIPGSNSANPNDGFVHGHPIYMGVTTGTPTGKVYVVSSDSSDVTIIRTDVDAIQTHLSLQGFGVSLRMTSP